MTSQYQLEDKEGGCLIRVTPADSPSQMGGVKPRSEAGAPAIHCRVAYNERIQPGSLTLLLRGLTGGHQAGQGVELSEAGLQLSLLGLVVLHDLHPPLRGQEISHLAYLACSPWCHRVSSI